MRLHVILGGVALLVMIIFPLESAAVDNCPAPNFLDLQGSADFPPEPPKYLSDLSFILYTSTAPEKTFSLSEPIANVLTFPGFVSSIPLVIILPGFRTTSCLPIMRELPDALLYANDANVLVLDELKYMSGPYDKVVSYLKSIAKLVAQWLADYSCTGRLVNKKIHLIGHSLGAHLSGFIGKIFFSLACPRNKIDRITGLDPAGPLFDGILISTANKLWRDDASFVDIIHTNAAVQGISQALGHIDFYPNGGTIQTNTENPTDPMENHRRAWKYFAESVYYPTHFPALFCADLPTLLYNLSKCIFRDPKTYMGYYVSRMDKGIYFLVTAGQSPYGLGQ